MASRTAPARSTVLRGRWRGRTADEFAERLVLFFERCHVFPVLFFVRLELGIQRCHVFPVLFALRRPLVPQRPSLVSRCRASRGAWPAWRMMIESIPDQGTLRGPDEGCDPNGGSLSRESGFLQGEGGLLPGRGLRLRIPSFGSLLSVLVEQQVRPVSRRA